MEFQPSISTVLEFQPLELNYASTIANYYINKIINKKTIITIIINIFLEILFVFCVDVFATIIVKYKELVHSPVKKIGKEMYHIIILCLRNCNSNSNMTRFKMVMIDVSHILYNIGFWVY